MLHDFEAPLEFVHSLAFQIHSPIFPKILFNKGSTLSKFASVNRDLALLMDKDITCGAVEDTIKDACKYITAVKLFDVYEGENIPADKKSLAFTITFTPGEEDFEADSVDKYVKKVLGNLKYKLNVEIRS